MSHQLGEEVDSGEEGDKSLSAIRERRVQILKVSVLRNFLYETAGSNYF